MEEMKEEYGGEEGLMADAKNDKDNICSQERSRGIQTFSQQVLPVNSISTEAVKKLMLAILFLYIDFFAGFLDQKIGKNCGSHWSTQ
ncbi:hypothetical protein ACFL6S_30575 [Candidatus Poribacteria bacterium]